MYVLLVFTTTPHQHILNACQAEPKYPGNVEQFRQFMLGRVQACIKSHGEHFLYFS
jgi:hypothetical protein